MVRVSDGDLRKAITFLQSAARLNVDKEITERAVVDIAGVRRPSSCQIGDWFLFLFSSRVTLLSCSLSLQVVPPKMIDNLLQICFTGTFEKLEVAVRVGVLTNV